MSEGPAYDVVVIGAGLVGCALARELSASRLRVALVEARDDVGDGTSKANTAILHTGFDAAPGTLESRLVRRGYELLSAYAVDAGIPVERTGAVLVAWTDEQAAVLPGLQAKAQKNGYDATRLITAEEVYAAEPHLGPGVRAGLIVPDESITCTWTTNLALATDAVRRGATLLLGHAVRDVQAGAEATVVRTSRGELTTRWVVNAAGLGSDLVDRMLGHERFTITPRKGQLLVYDKLARHLVSSIVLPVPTALGKGVLVSPTVYGNVMVGPTAEDIDDRTDTATTTEGVAFLAGKAADLVPALAHEEVTATYAGLRAASEHTDYVVAVDAAQRYAVAGGIRSTGLTACMSIAEHVVGELVAAGLDVAPRDDLPPTVRMPNLGEAFPRPYQDAERIAADPDYGRIVCFCERVTAGEIRDALGSTIPPRSIGGLRRRTRAMNGRCQGFFCGAEVAERLAEGGAP
jgi:glycerol-3-phosphate dehydrogenase